MRPLKVMMAAMALAALGTLSPAVLSPAAAQDTGDYMKRAQNFLTNCDARAGPDGVRPDPNYVCLAFVAGLIEGYNYAAVANGNPRPYCLVRPTSLVEMMDMMSTVIERGLPPELPTAAVFHFILTENFPCSDAQREEQGNPGAPAATEATPEPAEN